MWGDIASYLRDNPVPMVRCLESSCNGEPAAAAMRGIEHGEETETWRADRGGMVPSPCPSVPHPEFGYASIPEPWHKQELVRELLGGADPPGEGQEAGPSEPGLMGGEVGRGGDGIAFLLESSLSSLEAPSGRKDSSLEAPSGGNEGDGGLPHSLQSTPREVQEERMEMEMEAYLRQLRENSGPAVAGETPDWEQINAAIGQKQEASG